MDSERHRGKHVFITGGGSGMGRATALRFAREGAARIYLVEPALITDDYHRTDWTPELRNRQRAVYSEYRERMKQVGGRMNVPVVDVYPRFAADPGKFIFADGIHPNCKGQRIYAEELYRQLRRDLAF